MPLQKMSQLFDQSKMAEFSVKAKQKIIFTCQTDYIQTPKRLVKHIWVCLLRWLDHRYSCLIKFWWFRIWIGSRDDRTSLEEMGLNVFRFINFYLWVCVCVCSLVNVLHVCEDDLQRPEKHVWSQGTRIIDCFESLIVGSWNWTEVFSKSSKSS